MNLQDKPGKVVFYAQKSICYETNRITYSSAAPPGNCRKGAENFNRLGLLHQNPPGHSRRRAGKLLRQRTDFSRTHRRRNQQTRGNHPQTQPGKRGGCETGESGGVKNQFCRSHFTNCFTTLPIINCSAFDRNEKSLNVPMITDSVLG